MACQLGIGLHNVHHSDCVLLRDPSLTSSLKIGFFSLLSDIFLSNITCSLKSYKIIDCKGPGFSSGAQELAWSALGFEFYPNTKNKNNRNRLYFCLLCPLPFSPVWECELYKTLNNFHLLMVVSLIKK